MRNKGSMLITTLWITAILSLLAMGIGFRASLELRLSKYNMDRLEARYLAKAGLTKTRGLLSEDKISFDNIEVFGDEANKLGNGSFSVCYTQKKYHEDDEDLYYGVLDEERKININMNTSSPGNPGEFKRILGGLSPDMTLEIINAIMDWQDGGDFDPATLPGGAEDYYYENEHGYSCKDANFETIQELLLVKGVTVELYSEIKDYITVYSNGKININTASRKVLEAIINDGGGTYSSLVNEILDYRKGGGGEGWTEDDNVFTNIDTVLSIAGENFEKIRINQMSPYFIFGSDNFRIISHGKIGDIKQVITCVVERDLVSKKTDIKYYHEE